MRRMKYAICFCFILFLCLDAAIFLLSKTPPDIVKSMKTGDLPKVFTEEKQYFSSLSDYAVHDDFVYVLFGDIGVLEVYSLDGVYQASFAFGIQKTGTAELFVNADGVWLEDQGHALFCFCQGEYVKSGSAQNDKSLRASFLASEDARVSADGWQYHLNWTSIFRSKDKSEVVIERPWTYILVQGFVPLILHFLVLVSFAALFFVIRKK